MQLVVPLVEYMRVERGREKYEANERDKGDQGEARDGGEVREMKKTH